MQTFTFETWIYRGPTEREYPVEVTYSVTPGRPARLYGDYPHPAEDAEFEIVSAKCAVELTEDDYAGFEDEIAGRVEEDLAEYHAEAAEYRAEMRREDAWQSAKDIAARHGKAA